MSDTPQETMPEYPEPSEMVIRYRRSPTIGKLVAALAKAQLSFEAVFKDAENPAYSRAGKRSMYATLNSTIAATREYLAKNELVIIALPESFKDGQLQVTSMLVHVSDEFVESTVTMPAVDRVTPQEMGKLLTYARRYQWSGLTGTAPEDDDDANQASGVGSREAAQAVGEGKIAEAAKRQGKTPKALKSELNKKYIPSLFYLPLKSGGWQVNGDKQLLLANKDILEPFVMEPDGSGPRTIVVKTEDELDVLRSSLEFRQVPFEPLKAT